MDDLHFRDHCSRAMRELIRSEIHSHVIESIEASCWKLSRDMIASDPTCARQLYIQSCAKSVANLSRVPGISNGNDHLWRQVVEDRVDVSEIARMTANELNPIVFTQSKTKCFAATNLCESDQFVCPKCNTRRSVHYELQTRSADEATTVFISCLGCGQKWTE